MALIRDTALILMNMSPKELPTNPDGLYSAKLVHERSSKASPSSDAKVNVNSNATSQVDGPSFQSACANVSSSDASSGEEDEMTPMHYLERLFARHGVRLSGRRSNSHQRQLLKRPCVTEADAYDMETTGAVRTGDLEKLKELHGKGYSLDASNRHGESLLHISCRRGIASILKFMLLEAKVNPRVMDDMGRTAFHDVLWSSTPNFEAMDVLLEVLPPVSLLIQDVRGHTPFHYAPRKHWGVWLEYLREKEDVFVQWIVSRKQMAAAAKLRQSEMAQRTQQQSSSSPAAIIPAAGARSE